MMRKEIESHYAPYADMTYIVEYTMRGDEVLKVEVVGFYFGKPDEDATKQYKGKLVAEMK